MVSSGRLLEFAAVAFVVIIIPGPSVLFVVGRGGAGGLAMIGLGVTLAVTGRRD
jgi:threonine/homoserine/homoserine lactone efflux protein